MLSLVVFFNFLLGKKRSLNKTVDLNRCHHHLLRFTKKKTPASARNNGSGVRHSAHLLGGSPKHVSSSLSCWGVPLALRSPARGFHYYVSTSANPQALQQGGSTITSAPRRTPKHVSKGVPLSRQHLGEPPSTSARGFPYHVSNTTHSPTR